MQLPDRVFNGRTVVAHERVVAPYTVLQPQQPQQDFVETLRKAWRHRRLVVACTFGVAVVTAVIVALLPSHYVAEARVLVGVPPPRFLRIDQIMADVNPDADRVQNESFVMRSRDLAKQVIDKLHLTDNPEFNPDAKVAPAPATGLDAWLAHLESYLTIDWRHWFGISKPAPARTDAAAAAARSENRVIDILLSKVDVATLGRSNVLSVQADSLNPDTAAAIANTLANAYLSQQKSNKVSSTDQVEKYMQGRIAELRQQVQQSEQAIENYRRANQLYNTSANTGINMQQLAELNTQLTLAQTAKAEADAHLQEARSMQRSGVDNGSVPEVQTSPLIQALKEQEAAAEQKLARLSANYGERHPQVIDARAQLSGIRRKIQMEMGSIVSSLQQQARTADARYGALQRDFDQAKAHMGGAGEKTIHLDELERDATVNRNLLATMEAHEREMVGQTEFEQPDARLVSPAAPPESPSFPPKSLIFFLGTMAGLLGGVLLALMREGTDSTFRRREQVESETGLPVISLVPEKRGMPPTVHVLHKPVSAFSESLRKIYIGLEMFEAAAAPKTVMMCSSTPGEGKSVLIASLGRLLASQGKRILLIDCDWRYPNLHRLFKVANRGGLASLLSEENVVLNDCIHQDALSGLDLITAGHWDAQNLNLLTSDRMRLLLQAFAKNYDLVIIDTAPVLVGSEILALSRMVDKLVFLVRWGHTNRGTVLEALRQLVDAHAPTAGIVLSRVDPKRYRQYSYGPLNYEYARPAPVSHQLN